MTNRHDPHCPVCQGSGTYGGELCVLCFGEYTHDPNKITGSAAAYCVAAVLMVAFVLVLWLLL